MQLNRTKLIIFSGLIWLSVGIMLLSVGFKYLIKGAAETQTLITCITLALILGYLKGRYILKKSVHREVFRILSITKSVRISDLYSKKYYILLAIMVCLGYLMNALALPPIIRGTIDITIGSALIKGAMLYFIHAVEANKHCT